MAAIAHAVSYGFTTSRSAPSAQEHVYVGRADYRNADQRTLTVATVPVEGVGEREARESAEFAEAARRMFQRAMDDTESAEAAS